MGPRTMEAPAVPGITLDAQEEMRQAQKERTGQDLATHASRTMEAEQFEKWLKEHIQIRIMSTERERGNVDVTVNGEKFSIKRNEWVSIPRYVEHALNNAVVETTRNELNPINPLLTIVVEDIQVRFPFQTTADGPSARSFYETKEMREMLDENVRLAKEAEAWKAKFAETSDGKKKARKDAENEQAEDTDDKG